MCLFTLNKKKKAIFRINVGLGGAVFSVSVFNSLLNAFTTSEC